MLLKYGSDGVNPYTAAQANPVWAPLKSGLHVWFEYSNEVWNDGFVQAHINRGLAYNEVSGTAGGTTLNYDGTTDLVTLGDRRVAKRLKEFSEIFAGVYGAGAINTTVRPILAYQLAAYRFNTQLSFIEAVYGKPKNYFYAVAVAPYFNLNGADSNPNLSSQDVLNALSSSIDGYQNSNTLDSIVTLATYYGLKMTAYEGGPDTFGPNNIAAKKAATLDPQMTNLAERYLNVWYQKGGDQFNWFTLGAGSFDTQYGTYSITDNLANLNEPKELGYLNIRNGAKPRPTAGVSVPGEIDARYSVFGPGQFSGSYDVRFISAGSTFDYLFNASTAGNYKIVVNAGNNGVGAAPIQIYVNDTLAGTDTVPAAPYGVYNDTPGLTAAFNAGLNTVRIVVPQGRPGPDTYTLNTIKVENADGSGIANTLPYSPDFYSFQPQIGANMNYFVQFNVGDKETAASGIAVTATSDNPALVPNVNIQVQTGAFRNQYGNTFNRQLIITPLADQTGSANITVTLTDGGGLSRLLTFNLKVVGGFTGNPTNLTATAGNNSVVLNYSQATTGAGATSFTILRGATSGGPYTQIATGVTGFTYTDNTAVNGTTYYYVVVGTSGIGGDSGYSNEASATPFVAPGAPVLTAVGGYSYINLTWTAVSGATSYNVKRSSTSGGPYTVIGNVAGTSFLDQYLGQGAKFYYVVSAVNAFGEGPNSNEANATTGATVPGEIEARILSAPGFGYGSSAYQRFIGAGSTFTYNVNAATAASYDIVVSAGDGNTSAYPLLISVNGGANQTVTVQPTSQNFFLDTAPIIANLTAGANTITLTVPDNRPYDLNTIKVTPHGQVITNTLPFTSFYAFYPEIGANTAYTNLFEAHDNNTPADQISVTASSSDNPALFPAGERAGSERRLRNLRVQHFPRQLVATPAPNQSGSAIITLVVTDGTADCRERCSLNSR